MHKVYRSRRSIVAGYLLLGVLRALGQCCLPNACWGPEPFCYEHHDIWSSLLRPWKRIARSWQDSHCHEAIGICSETLIWVIFASDLDLHASSLQLPRHAESSLTDTSLVHEAEKDS